MGDAVLWLAGTVTILGLAYIGFHRLIEWALPLAEPDPVTTCQCGAIPLEERNVVSFTDGSKRHTREVCVRTLP